MNKKNTSSTMKLTTVMGAVNNNKEYYMFIPKQILFWGRFNIKFVAVFIGEAIPEELNAYRDNIVLWSKNLDLNTAFVAQNIRLYYPAIINIPEDEMVMITDMDMLPINDRYYKEGLESYTIDDFVYYRKVDGNQIYMCYNAAHPKTWGKVFGINSDKDVETTIYDNYHKGYDGVPGSTGWFVDQLTMYTKLIDYPHLKVLNRPIKRIETWTYIAHLKSRHNDFIKYYDDAHFHRNYAKNESFILDAERQLLANTA
jgi:hypothetical protein